MTKIEFDLETTTTTDNHTSITSDRIRRRRNERESLDESEERCSSSLARLIANEAQLDSSRTGPVIPFLYRFGGTLKRIASSNAFLSSFMPVSDEDEEAGPRVTLIPHEKHYDEEQAADKNWIQRAYHSLHGDFASMGLLLFLYLLQGIPLGLIAAIPLVLQSKNVSYAEQAVFSFAHWPFSLKLFWAPIVDSVYCKRLGRRKSWMVPCQYLIGIFLVLLSYKVSNFMGENEPHSKPNVLFLMLVFLPLNFLAATQDIAVDGWALTMLSRKNVGYASTCNAVGQTAGFFMGNVVYLTLDSPEFANRFFRVKPQPYGLVTLSGFIFFWGLVFLFTTTLVLIFKKEVDHSMVQSDTGAKDVPLRDQEGSGEMELGIVGTYKILWKILWLKPMIWMIVVLLTCKIAFAATDGITGLKLIGMGMPKDKLASMAVFLTPLQVLLPWVIGKYTAGPRPLNVFLLAYPYRLLMGGVFAALVWWTPSFKLEQGDFPVILYVIWIAAYCFHQVAVYSMFVCTMAFNAQVSDPQIGGTYMTLLNTVNNLGGNWPVTVILSITDYLTFKDCLVRGSRAFLYRCDSKALADQCVKGGAVCETVVDGYFLSVAICSAIGILWYKLFYSTIKYFQKIPRKDWSVMKSS